MVNCKSPPPPPPHHHWSLIPYIWGCLCEINFSIYRNCKLQMWEHLLRCCAIWHAFVTFGGSRSTICGLFLLGFSTHINMHYFSGKTWNASSFGRKHFGCPVFQETSKCTPNHFLTIPSMNLSLCSHYELHYFLRDGRLHIIDLLMIPRKTYCKLRFAWSYQPWCALHIYIKKYDLILYSL